MEYYNKVLVAIILSFIVFLAGCGSGALNSGTESVEFYSDKTDDEIVFNEISDLISEDSDLSIDFVGYSDPAAFQTTVQQTLGDEDSPGMFTWWSGHRLENMAETGQIVDLTDEWENYYIEQGVNPELAEAFKINDKIYAAPLSVLYSGMFYNVEIFEEYNLEIPTTFDEFLSLCATLKSEGITPIGTKNDPWASFLWFQQLVGAYNPELYASLTNGEVAYNDEEVVEVMNVYKTMIEEGYFAEPVDYNTLGRQFSSGDVAMAYEPTAFTTGLEEDYGMVSEEEYSIFVMPPMDSSDNTVIFYEASPIVVSASSSQKDNAIEVLREIYKAENHQIYADYQNSAFVEGVEVNNETSQKIGDVANNGGSELMIRYYEATPSSIVDTATDNLWEFFYNPSDSSIEQALNNIQNQAEETFAN